MLENAEKAVEIARRLGADEVKAWFSRSTEVELQQREGRLERVHEASSAALSVSLLVDGRYSSHGTADLRPDALLAFLERAVAATRVLEPDPDRALADRSLMGSQDEALLDLDDRAAFSSRGAEQRRAEVSALEAAVRQNADPDLISATVGIWESRSESAAAFSNGFAAQRSRTGFGRSAEATMRDPDGKLPEAYTYFSAAHLGDLPPLSALADDLWERAKQVRKASPGPSGVFPMLLDARQVGRILSAVLAPLGGGNLHEGRSCWADRLGTRIGSERFTLVDDPAIPRGAGSRSFDGDGFPGHRRAIIENGVLKTFFLDNYYARKLGRPPTGGGTSNLVIAPGERDWCSLAKDAGRCIRVLSFLGGNSNPASGDFSLGIRGQLVEGGEVVANLSEMNITGTLEGLLDSYEEAANDVWTFSSVRSPTLLFGKVQFSGK